MYSLYDHKVSLATFVRRNSVCRCGAYVNKVRQSVANLQVLIQSVMMSVAKLVSWPLGYLDFVFESRSRHLSFFFSLCVLMSCLGIGPATDFSPVHVVRPNVRTDL
jgi:hypothetical protein